MGIGIIASAIVPALDNTVLPVANGSTGIAGTALLSCTTGTWVPTPASYTYQWQRDLLPIDSAWVDEPGATASTFTPTNVQGGRWRCKVTASNGSGALTPAYSNYVTLTQPGPTSTVAPTIAMTGSGNAGSSTLTVTNNGTWSPPGTSYTYQWQLGGVDVPGATAVSYAMGIDAGGSWRCRVTATNLGGSTTASSNAINVTQLAPVRITWPYVSGAGGAGSQRTCSPGTWSPLAVSYTYQWYHALSEQDGYTVSGAPGAATNTVVVSPGLWKCLVTATNSGGSTQAYSNEVSVQGVPVLFGIPMVEPSSVAPQQIAYFSCSTGSWSNNPTSYDYQWQLFDNVSTWNSIPGANSPNYTSYSTQINNSIYRCLVQANNAYGSSGFSSSSEAIQYD